MSHRPAPSPGDGAGLSSLWRFVSKEGRRPAWTYGLALVVFLGLAAFLHRPLFEVRGFSPKDDWKPLRVTRARPFHPQVERHVRDFGFANIKWEWRWGRFTPAWNVAQVLEARAFKSSPAAWQAERLALAVAAALFLFHIFLRVGASFVPALFGGLWFLARGQELWVEKQYQEATAVVWLLASVALFLRAGRTGRRCLDWCGFAALMISGLTKESFILLVPAVLLIRIRSGRGAEDWAGLRRSLSRARPVLIAAGAAFFGQILLLAFLYLNGRYGRTVAGNLWHFKLSQLADVVRLNAPALSYFVPALGLALVLRGGPGGRLGPRVPTLAALILAAWLIPQFVLFKENGLAGHYAYAAMPALAALNVLGLEVVRRRASAPARALFAAMCAFGAYTIGLSLPATRNVAELQAARADAYSAASAFCAASVSAGGSVLIVSDRPSWGLGISLLFDLDRRGITAPVSFDCPPSAVAAGGQPGRDAISRELISRYFPPVTAVPPGSLKAIVSTVPAPRFLKAAGSDYPWFVAGEWVGVPFESSYSLFETGSLRRPAWRRSSRQLRYEVFIRK